MSEVKFTRTATFLFPLLEISKNLFDCDIRDKYNRPQHKTRFLNAYLKHEGITQEEDCLYLVLRNYRDVSFDIFYSTIQALPNYVDDYDSQGCCIFIFSVPEKRQKDFDLIKNGKYSEVSAEAKKAILMNNFFSGKVFTLPLVLNKAEALKNSWEDRLSTPGSPAELKDQEVWPIIELENEELNNSIMSKITTKKELSPTGEF
jgi:uncharacterized protein YutD